MVPEYLTIAEAARLIAAKELSQLNCSTVACSESSSSTDGSTASFAC